MQVNSICDEIVCTAYRSVVDVVLTDAGDFHDLVPEHIAYCQRVKFPVIEEGCHAMQPRAARCEPPGSIGKSGVHRGRKLAMRHSLCGKRLLDLRPHLFGYRVGPWTAHSCIEFGENVPRRLSAGAVHANITKETDLVVSPIDRQMPAVAVARLRNGSDSGVYIQTQQQLCNAVD